MKNQFAGDPIETEVREPLDTDFPKCKYHPQSGSRVVRTPEEEAVLGEGWHDSPADFPEVEPPAPEPNPDCPSCMALVAEISAQTASFNAEWLDVTQQNASLVQDLASVRGELADANAASADLKQQNADLVRDLASARTEPEKVPAPAIAEAQPEDAAAQVDAQSVDATADAQPKSTRKPPKKTA